MPPVHIQQRAVARSRIPQTNFGTQTAVAAAAFVELLLSDQNLGRHTVNTQDNTGYSTRNDFPTDQWTLSHDVERPFEMDLSSEQVGRDLYGVCGSVVTAQPAAVSDPTVYRHTFVPQDPNVSRQLPAFSVVEQLGGAGGAIDRLFRGCVYEGLSLRGEGINRIKGSFTLRGSGKVVKPSGVTWATHVNPVTGQKYFTNSAIEVTVADAGTLSNAVNHGATKRIESWTVDYANNLAGDAGYRPGSTDFQDAGDVTSGAIRSELLFLARTIGLGFVTRIESGSAEESALQSQKDLDVRISLIGPTISNAYKHQLDIHAVLARYAAVEIGNSNGFVTLAVTPKPLWDAATSKIIEFILTNTTASYTT